MSIINKQGRINGYKDKESGYKEFKPYIKLILATPLKDSEKKIVNELGSVIDKLIAISPTLIASVKTDTIDATEMGLLKQTIALQQQLDLLTVGLDRLLLINASKVAS